jgi:hypothetical protein
MGPIQPLGIGRPGWLDRPSSIGDATQIGGAGLPGANQAAPLMAGQTISGLGISTSVSQLLNSVGVQNNQMLEMMIALLIIISLLEQQRSGGDGSTALSMLGGSGSGMTSSTVSFSSTVVSTHFSSMTYSEMQVNQMSGGNQAGNANPPQIDTTA